MSSIARLETTYAYNKQKVVIDVADLMNTEGYYEAIAMSPDGRIEYEVMHTKDRQEALDAFERYKLRAQGGYPEGVYTKEQWSTRTAITSRASWPAIVQPARWASAWAKSWLIGRCRSLRFVCAV